MRARRVADGTQLRRVDAVVCGVRADKADRALYVAKEAGRNCVRIEELRDLPLSAEQPSTAA